MSNWFSKIYDSIVDEISNRVVAKLRKRSMWLRTSMDILQTNDDGIIVSESTFENFVNLHEIATIYKVNKGCVVILKGGYRFNCNEEFDRMCELVEISG